MPSVEVPAACDVAIVGTGYMGLTAAYVLARAGARVVVFERGTVGAGASARNAGFCTISPPFSATGLIATDGHDGARRWLRWFRSAVERVEALAEEVSSHGRTPIGFRRVGRLRLAETMAQASSLKREAELARPARPLGSSRVALSERITTGERRGAIVDEKRAPDPAAPRRLAAAAHKAGVRIAEHCAVQRAVDHGSDRIQVLHAKGATTASARRGNKWVHGRRISPFRDRGAGRKLYRRH
jgi:gamma-glutamylputrescine oxidase